MTDTTALNALLASVEAGDTKWSAHDVALAFGRNVAGLFYKAFHGSIDAAKALHDAVLPGWVVHEIGSRYGGVWEVDLMQLGEGGWHNEGDGSVNVWAAEPARAWLIAIIKAIIAQEAT